MLEDKTLKWLLKLFVFHMLLKTEDIKMLPVFSLSYDQYYLEECIRGMYLYG